MSKILITGVTGFAGTNLVRYFSARGMQLVGHTRDKATAEAQFAGTPGFIVIDGDISAARLNELGITDIIHLAGIAHDLSNQYKPEDYYRVNFEATAKVYDQFLMSAASQFIFISSIKAAVDVAASPVDETIKPAPVGDYGKSKYQAEQYITSKTHADKRFYILRPCMIHGEGNKGNLNLLYQYAKRGLPFPFGSFPNQRSFLNIDNFSFIIDRIVNTSIVPGTYHLADDGYLSTTELYRLLATTMGRRALVINVPTALIKIPVAIIGKTRMLNKLTESMMVSNAKIVKAIGGVLPMSIGSGIVKTIKSFHE
jgi:nucleoside-diphosphate-sugar epimerase